jgi:DNA-binding MarR family transcriptional regulator
MTNVTQDERTSLLNTMRALEPFKNLRATMPLQYVNAFLLVATQEGKNVTEYARQAGISQSLMTRHLSDLGTINRYHEEGFGLVEHTEDPMDRRNRLVTLTAKGQGVVEHIVRAHRR